MTVTIKKPESEAPETVKLEVVGVKRYVPLNGPLYEAGVIYTFSKAQAERILKIVVDGRPVFDYYKPERYKKMVVVGPDEVDMSANDLRDLVPQAATRMELGDDSELEDIPGLRDEGGVRV